MSSLPENEFSREERRAMLALARATILSAFTGTSVKLPEPRPRCFSLRRGVFVTIRVYGKLRGCIGVIEASEPLQDTIAHCAESAAYRDSRFSVLRSDEVDGLQIEISILSELAPLTPEQVEIGRHGLLIASSHRHGLLLPQVAVEHHLSREEFLAETCRKAGLPDDAWKGADSQLFGFTCEIFQEERSDAVGE
jgi:AmmeMemoRadiSam system protein A